MPGSDRHGGIVFAILAAAWCCAAPAMVALGSGALAAAAGLVARYWPLSVLGGIAIVFGAVRIVSLVRVRRGKASRGSDGR